MVEAGRLRLMVYLFIMCLIIVLLTVDIIFRPTSGFAYRAAVYVCVQMDAKL